VSKDSQNKFSACLRTWDGFYKIKLGTIDAYGRVKEHNKQTGKELSFSDGMKANSILK
jgi:hypothetical protein